jgi:hypothetical protein
MFAVTTTTNVASTAKQCFSGKKTTSSRKSFSSIVKASASSSEEKFDRREMLKNALVASVATVVATPKPVRAIESSSQSSFFRLLRAERSLSLYFERQFRAVLLVSLVDRSRFLDLSSLSLREVEKESKSSFSRMRMQYFSSFFFSFFIKN